MDTSPITIVHGCGSHPNCEQTTCGILKRAQTWTGKGPFKRGGEMPGCGVSSTNLKTHTPNFTYHHCPRQFMFSCPRNVWNCFLIKEGDWTRMTSKSPTAAPIHWFYLFAKQTRHFRPFNLFKYNLMTGMLSTGLTPGCVFLLPTLFSTSLFLILFYLLPCIQMSCCK